jgi:hypothetical protein
MQVQKQTHEVSLAPNFNKRVGNLRGRFERRKQRRYGAIQTIVTAKAPYTQISIIRIRVRT